MFHFIQISNDRPEFPRLNKPSSLSLFLLLSVLANPVGSFGEDASVNPGIIRSTLRAQWESLESIEYGCDEFLLTSDGTRDSSKAVMRYEFAQSRGGRKTLTVTNLLPDGEVRVVTDFREDGKNHFRLIPFQSDSHALSAVSIRPQQNLDANYKGVMFSILWLLSPAGRPVFAHAESGTIVATSDAGIPGAKLTSACESGQLECILDPVHDWLPRRVSFSDSEKQYWEVTKFQRDNGRWYPAEGTYGGLTPHGYQVYGFTVDNLKINRHLASGRFSMPPLVDGVMVTDFAAKRTQIMGGPAARKRLLTRYSKTLPPSDAQGRKPAPILASRNPSSIRWATIISAISVLLLMTAGIRMALSRTRVK